MAYDEFLVDRVRQVLNEKKTSFEEKKMMSGLCFMVDGKMCIGVDIDKKTDISRIMARVGEGNEIDMQNDLEYWIQLCLDFNPLAKSSKKKKYLIHS